MKYLWQDQLLEDHLRFWAGGMPLYRACFFFAKKGTSELQRSLQGLYRTLLVHFIESDKSLARVAFPRWQFGDAGRQPEVSVLRSALTRILKHQSFSRKYFFFIDGLDEYGESDPKLQTELSRDILSLCNIAGVKIVVASRPEAPFAGRFAECPTLCLQNLTEGDISAYVTAEVRRKAIPHIPKVSGEHDTIKIAELADKVVRKARGVFLWVVLAVTDLVIGIDEAESYDKLDERLDGLDNDLYILFKQIIFERIRPAYRQQIVRHLLISFHNNRVNFWHRLVVHAVGHQVQVNSISTQPDIYDVENNWKSTMDLVTQISVRSHGLCSDFGPTFEPDCNTNVGFVHSSMWEFLADPDTRNLLREQAGDFEPGQAVTIGLMAHLWMYQHESHKGTGEGTGVPSLGLLTHVISSIEVDRHFSGVVPVRSMTCLKILLEKPWDADPSSTLASLKGTWDFPAIGRSIPHLRATSGFLEFATCCGFTYYLQSQIELNHGIPHTNNLPLLFWAIPQLRGIGESISYLFRSAKNQWTDRLELLLQHGANPNGTYQGRTP